MDNEKIFDLMTRMYSEMQEGFKKVDKRFDALETRVDRIETRVDRIEKTVLKIENDHGQKLQALFDGFKQHTDQLDRIEKEVSRHDEFLLKRV